MGRPSKDTNIEDEKRLTAAVCGLIHANSNLSYAELEDVFCIGVLSSSGKKTGKSFSRYCKVPPEKGSGEPDESRAAQRSDLQRFVQISIKKGWITSAQIREMHLDPLLQLSNSRRASEVLLERKREGEDLLAKFKLLQKAVDEAQDALAAAKYFSYQRRNFGATREAKNPLHRLLWEDQVYVVEDEDGGQTVQNVPELCYSYSGVPYSLSLLSAHLDDSRLSLRQYEPSLTKELEVPKPPRIPKDAKMSGEDLAKLWANLDDLIKGL